MEGQTVRKKGQGEERPRYSYSQRVCLGIVSEEYCYSKTGKSQPSLIPQKKRGFKKKGENAEKKRLVKKVDKTAAGEKRGCVDKRKQR